MQGGQPVVANFPQPLPGGRSVSWNCKPLPPEQTRLLVDTDLPGLTWTERHLGTGEVDEFVSASFFLQALGKARVPSHASGSMGLLRSSPVLRCPHPASGDLVLRAAPRKSEARLSSGTAILEPPPTCPAPPEHPCSGPGTPSPHTTTCGHTECVGVCMCVYVCARMCTWLHAR